MAVDRGALVIGDISGYAGYLTGVELEHSHDVIADLLDTMVQQATGVLTLSKLEGDAMFWYRIAPVRGSRCSPRSKLCTQRSGAGFGRSCTRPRARCNACRQIPSLNLKMVAHSYTWTSMGTIERLAAE